MNRPPEKYFIFKLRGRWCAVQHASKEEAVAWANQILDSAHRENCYKYYDSQLQALQNALDSVCMRAGRVQYGNRVMLAVGEL